MKAKCCKFFIALTIAVFFNSSVKSQTFKLDFQNPQGVFDAMFYAANTGDTTILKFLCPPKVELFGLKGDHRQICRCDSWVSGMLETMKQDQARYQIVREVSRKVLKPQIEEITFEVSISGNLDKVNLFYCFGNYYLGDF